MRPIRGAVALALALALWPAAARAGDEFAAGEYRGSNGQGLAVQFAADPTGVHVFSTRLRLSCRDGERRRQRVWIAHVDLSLDGSAGQFAYDRRRGTRDVLRVTGTLSGTVASGTVLRRRGRCSSGIRPWTAVATGSQGMHDHHSDPRLMAGNMAPYPALELAGARNRRRAEALRAATIAAAPLYSTIALATCASAAVVVPTG